MRITFLFILVFLTAADLFAVRVALLGDRELTDPATVELSSDAGVELLERGELDKILAERKLSVHGLSGTELRSCFPHADLIVAAEKSRVVIFNAKNGFRLCDEPCANLVAQVKRATGKIQMSNPVYLSVVTVRDVGVPGSRKPDLEKTVTALEQQLMKHPQIQLLERRRLDTVLTERELSETRCELTPSARLITLEFEAGSSAGQVKIKLLGHDLSGKEIFRLQISGGLDDPAAIARALATGIADKLGSSPDPVSPETLAEANRIFAEYRRLVHSQGSGQDGEIDKYRNASPKLFAALALAPRDPKIRLAELVHYSKMLRTVPVSERLTPAREQLERVKQYYTDFPQARVSICDPEMICGAHLVLNSSEFPAQKEGYAALYRELREMHLEENRRNYYPYDLTDGIGSLTELEHYHDVVIRSNYPFLFFCRETEWRNRKLADYSQLFHLADRYIADHPDQADRVNAIIREQYLTELVFPNTPVNPDELGAFLDKTRELCEFVASSRLDSVKVPCFTLDCMREALRGKTPDAFQREFFRLLDRIAAFRPELLRPWEENSKSPRFLRSATYHDFDDFCSALLKKYDLPDNWLRDYQARHGMDLDSQDLIQAAYDLLRCKKEAGYQQMKKHPARLRELNRYHLIDNNFGNGCRMLADYLFETDGKNLPPDPDRMAFFTKLNNAFEIETGSYAGLRGGTCPEFQLKGAAERDGELALFFSNDEILTFDLSRNKWEPAARAPSSLPSPQGGPGSQWKLPLALNATHIAYADSEGNLRIFDRATKRWTACPELFPEMPRSLFIAGDRVYALAGDEEWSVQNRPIYMLRCKLDGSGREVLFSSERSEKLDGPDRYRGGLSGLTQRSPGKLVFLLTYTNNYTIVWEYDIAAGTFRILFRAPIPGTDVDALWKGRDGSIYLVSCSWSERLYRLAPGAERAEWIFAQRGDKRKKDPREDHPALFHGHAHLQAPWLVTGDTLWTGGGRTACLDLKHPQKNPPFLLLPRTRYLFELPDGRVLFLGDYRYFIVGKKTKIGE